MRCRVLFVSLSLVGLLAFGCDPAADLDPPTITLGPDLSVRDTSVTIAFVTDEPANAIIEYGPTTAYGTTVLDNRYLKDHEVLVRNLNPQTTYNMRLLTYDALDNGPTTSANFEITTLTLQPPPPVVVNEVMANAAVEDSGEFVELFNYGAEAVSVAGWEVSDGDSSDPIIPFTLLGSDATSIDPGAFAVILDPDYGQGGEDYNFPPGTVLFTTDDTAIGDGFGISNGTDPISIRSVDGKTVSTYGTPENPNDAIPFDAGNAVSVERCVPTGLDEVTNWHASDDAAGHTAGRPNTSATCP